MEQKRLFKRALLRFTLKINWMREYGQRAKKENSREMKKYEKHTQRG